MGAGYVSQHRFALGLIGSRTTNHCYWYLYLLLLPAPCLRHLVSLSISLSSIYDLKVGEGSVHCKNLIVQSLCQLACAYLDFRDRSFAIGRTDGF